MATNEIKLVIQSFLDQFQTFEEICLLYTLENEMILPMVQVMSKEIVK